MIRKMGFAEILDAPNADALLEEYAAECAQPELGAFYPQREAYALMEKAGALQCFGAFEDGCLAGFAAVLAYPVPHYGTRIATVESLFLAKAHRKGGAGTELLHAIEDHGREMNCAAVLYSAPVGSRLARLLFLQEDRYRNSHQVFLRKL